MASAENSISESPNLKIFWGSIPPDPFTRLVPSALAIMPPVKKNLATAPGNAKKSRVTTMPFLIFTEVLLISDKHNAQYHG